VTKYEPTFMQDSMNRQYEPTFMQDSVGWLVARKRFLRQMLMTFRQTFQLGKSALIHNSSFCLSILPCRLLTSRLTIKISIN